MGPAAERSSCVENVPPSSAAPAAAAVGPGAAPLLSWSLQLQHRPLAPGEEGEGRGGWRGAGRWEGGGDGSRAAGQLFSSYPKDVLQLRPPEYVEGVMANRPAKPWDASSASQRPSVQSALEGTPTSPGMHTSCWPPSSFTAAAAPWAHAARRAAASSSGRCGEGRRRVRRQWPPAAGALRPRGGEVDMPRRRPVGAARGGAEGRVPTGVRRGRTGTDGRERAPAAAGGRWQRSWECELRFARREPFWGRLGTAPSSESHAQGGPPRPAAVPSCRGRRAS